MHSFFKTLLLGSLLTLTGVLIAAEVPSLQSGMLKDIDASADSYEYIGSNIIARGHVVIVYKHYHITAEKAIVNTKTQGIELIGNVTFATKDTSTRTVSPEQYEELQRDPRCSVKIIGRTTTTTGKQSIQVSVTRNTQFMRAERAYGNLASGVFQFQTFVFRNGIVYGSGDRAERLADGTLIVHDAKATTCEYMLDNHEHYSITADRLVVEPRDYAKGIQNYSTDHGDHSIWAYNTWLKFFDVPVLWLPALYKPRNTSGFGVRTAFGRTSRLGYFLRFSKNFDLLDEPYLNGDVMLDFYSERGWGYGINGNVIMPESKTDYLFYGIWDKKPYNYWSTSYDDGTPVNYFTRMKIPNYRYALMLSNVTHITPRLDFRGQVSLFSDYNFLRDYFPGIYAQNIQPPTNAALEYQFDRASLSLFTTLKVNSFDTVVQRIPSITLDIPRQELFANVYYQGMTSMDYLNMNWRSYDLDPKKGPVTQDQILRNYSSIRFDSLHMFYYPIQLDWLNIIPRAGMRFTAYSNTSENPITYDDLSVMLANDSPDGYPVYSMSKQYDNQGGAKLRVMGELGVQMNTKIYRSWNHVKNAYWELDGLRHVAVPYINYTYIPKPTLSADNIYYFDDIDRLTEQNFARIGIVNRLQTRRDGQIYEWFSMENYWDFHFTRQEGFKNIGDLSTIVRFNPFPGFSISSKLILDVGQSNDHDAQAVRNGVRVGRPGISSKWINRWETTVSYSFAKHWKVSAAYMYSDKYNQRTLYSMGSMLQQISATTTAETSYGRSQTISMGFDFPILYDYTKLKGGCFVSYDVEAALLRDLGFRVTRTFHCWDLSMLIGKRDYKNNGQTVNSFYVGFVVNLTDLPGFSLSGTAALDDSDS